MCDRCATHRLSGAMQMPKQICVRLNKAGWCWSGAFTMQAAPLHPPLPPSSCLHQYNRLHLGSISLPMHCAIDDNKCL